MDILYRKILLLLTTLVVLISISCNSEPDRTLVISNLKNSSKLATVEYVVSKIISAKDENWFAKDAYFFAETEASIKVGVDLEKLKEEDISIQGKRISIKLPPVEIINFSYPAEGFKVIKRYSENNAILKWNSIGVKQKDELYRQGEIDIRNNIKNLGIIATAQKNARTLLTKVLQLSGFQEIYVEFKSNNNELISQDKQMLKELKELLLQQKN